MVTQVSCRVAGLVAWWDHETKQANEAKTQISKYEMSLIQVRGEEAEKTVLHMRLMISWRQHVMLFINFLGREAWS